MSVREGLRIAKKALEAGNFREADRIYTAILKSTPDNIIAIVNLAKIAVKFGKVAVAKNLFIKSLKLDPHLFQNWLSLIELNLKMARYLEVIQLCDAAEKKFLHDSHILDRLSAIRAICSTEPVNGREFQEASEHYNNGRYSEALELATDIKSSHAVAPNLSNFIACCHMQLGEIDEAESIISKLFLSSEFFAPAFNTLGMISEKTGNTKNAIKNFTKSTEIDDQNPTYWVNLGNAYSAALNFSQSIIAYKTAINLSDTPLPGTLNNLANSFRSVGDIENAQVSMKSALSYDPLNLGFLLNLGSIYSLEGDWETAQEYYKTAINHHPDSTTAHYHLCELYEISNQEALLHEALEETKTRFGEIPVNIKFHEAKLSFREERYSDCKEFLENLDLNQLGRALHVGKYYELAGKCYDKLNMFNEAYSSFKKMNTIAQSSDEFKRANPREYLTRKENQFSSCKEIDQEFKSMPKTNTTADKNLGSNLVFLIGFPRSGTTLLDTMLRSHTEISVLEEREMIQEIVQFHGITTGQEILKLTAAQLSVMRSMYFKIAKKHVDTDSCSILVDKLPLNILEIPLIHRMFPLAKFIIAHRHPMDSILSCWMQNFRLNSPMAVMTDLSWISEYYDLCFRSLEWAKETLNISFIDIKYEKLLDDNEAILKEIMTFLSLDWESSMLDYTDTAKKRRRIRTPSYSQVIKPLYMDAKYRWVRYADLISNQCNTAQHWVEKLNYGN